MEHLMSVSLINTLRETPFCFVDVETTGASADYGDRIIEIGVMRVQGGQPVARLDQLIDPGRRISPGVVALTGINAQMVSGQPRFDQVLERVTELMRGAVVVGHNVRFDLSFIHSEYRRARVGFAEALGRTHVIDTLRLARRRFGRGGNGLQRLARRLGILPPVAHRAMADVQTTWGVFCSMLEAGDGWNCVLCDLLGQQGGPMGLLPAGPTESLLPLELQEAIEQKGFVQLEYLDADENRTLRIIKPLRLRKRFSEMVLVAHCQLRDEQRTFKVERIVQMERVDEPEMTKPASPAPVQLGLFESLSGSQLLGQ
jgi:DNA polymerase III epsilon subunit family exonuclease